MFLNLLFICNPCIWICFLNSEEITTLQAVLVAQITVAGVSFHVGSGVTHASAYHEAIGGAGAVFNAAAELGILGSHVLYISGDFMAGTRLKKWWVLLKAAV